MRIVLTRIFVIGGGVGFLLMVVLQIMSDKNLIRLRLAYTILEFYWLILAVVAVPFVFRLALEGSTWIQIGRFFRNLPNSARKASYFRLLFTIVMCCFFVFVLWKTFALRWESVAVFTAIASVVVITVGALWVVPKMQARNLSDSIEKLVR